VKRDAVFSASTREILSHFFYLGFDDLLGKMEDRRLVEHGYTVRDLALSCLTSFHNFDTRRALPGISLQRRQLIFEHTEGGEQIEVPVFPGLNDEHFQAITFFAEREQWPFTPKGIFLELKHRENPPNTLKEAFYLTSEFQKVFTLFNREGSRLERDEVLALLLDGSFDLIKELFAECDFSRENRLAVLKIYLNENSKVAARILLEKEGEYALKKLDDASMLALMKITGDQALAQRLKKSVRSDAVRQVAEKTAPEVKKETPKVKEVVSEPKAKRTHLVKSGDTLWKIARAYKVDMQVLMQRNKITKADRIRPGQKLLID